MRFYALRALHAIAHAPCLRGERDTIVVFPYRIISRSARMLHARTARARVRDLAFAEKKKGEIKTPVQNTTTRKLEYHESLLNGLSGRTSYE